MPVIPTRRLLALVASCIALPCPAAQEAAPSPSTFIFDEIVVTASRIPQPLRRVGASLSVLNTSDLQDHGNLALQDILRQMPAVSVSSTGGAGKASSLRIRGEEGYRTLVLLDGIRLLDPSLTQTGPQFEHMLSSGLSRVEILRGPQGLAYGADAGGVVNISSLPYVGAPALSLDWQTGAHGLRQYAGTLGGGTERADFALQLSDLASAGFNAQSADTILRDHDGYANTSAHGRAGFALTDTLNIDLVRRRVRGNAEFDGCYHPFTFAAEHVCRGRFELDATRAALNYTTPQVTHTLAYATTDTAREDFAGGQSAFTARGELERWEYLGHLRQLPGFGLVFGADLEQARNNGEGRNNKGIFAEYLSDFSTRLYLGAGVRYDANEDFGSNTSYRLSSAYLVDTAKGTLKFKGSYGTGFRAPSPYEIAYNASSYSYPPASLVELQQEHSTGFEAGVEYQSSMGLHLEAVYFDQEVADAIYFDLKAYSGYLQDIGASTSHGVELSGAVPVSAVLQLQANYTWNDTQRPNGLQRPRRPAHQFNLGAVYTTRENRLRLQGFYRAARDALDDSGTGTVALDDYGVLDLGATFSLAVRVQLYARIENLLDEQYEELTGYNTAGRAAYVGLRLNY